MKRAYWPRFRSTSSTSAFRLLRRGCARAQQPADPREAQQTRDREEAKGRDGADEVEPAAPRDEVVALGVRAARFTAKSTRNTTQIRLS